MTESRILSPLDPEKIVTTEDAAAYLCLAPITLCRMRVRGDGPCFLKMNRAVRYRMADVRQWALDKQHAHTAEYSRAV